MRAAVSAPLPAATGAPVGAGRAVVVAASGALVVAFAIGLALWVSHAEALPQVSYYAWSSSAGRAVLETWGVPVVAWTAVLAGLQLLVALACVVAAWLLLLRGELSWFRLYLAFTLVFWGTAGSQMSLVLGALYPRLTVVGEIAQGLAWISLFPLAYVFPDGRFVPRWTRWLMAGWALYLVAAALVGDEALDGVLLLLFGSCAGAQVYRYARVSGPVARRQARWLMLALALWSGFALTLIVTPLRSLQLEATPDGLVAFACVTAVTTLMLGAIPAAIAIAIVRHRLFDVDVWLSRTLVYGVLTLFVVGVYAAVVSGIGALAGGDDGLPLVAAAIVAVAFSPLRARLQRRIDRFVYGRRDDPYRVLSDLARELSAVAQPEAIAATIVDAVAQALRAPYVAVEMGSSEEVAASTGRPVADVEAFAIDYRGADLGRLMVGRRGSSDRLSTGDRRLLEDLAGHCGAALYAAHEALQTRRLADDLQRAREQLVSAREEERRRIRRDLHDSLGPTLGSHVLTIDAARLRMRTDPAAADRMLSDLKSQSQEALAQVRQLARRLRPPELDELGLAGALALVCERAGSELPVTVDAPELPELPAAVEVAAYLIAQEALTNVVRHARAHTCRLSLVASGHALELAIEDDGCGMPSGDRAGIGTASMRERAAELGGSLTVESAAGRGTLVRATLPLTSDATQRERIR